jgi:nucleotide-binding universal stress UspA family protein
MYKNILVSVDLNEQSSWQKALPTAVACGRAFGAKLHLFSVVPDFGMSVVAQYFPEDYAATAVAEAREALSKLAADHVPGECEVTCVVGFGAVYEEILKAARETGCDLIVMASHRPHLEDFLLGPNAAQVVRHAGCSVLVVRDEASG